MKLKYFLAAAFMEPLFIASSASAAVIIRTYNFTATGFNKAVESGDAIPQSVVTGSITVSFDDAVTALNQIGTLNSLSIPFSGNVLFSYYAIDGSLSIGGNDLNSSVANTNDFALSIRDANTSTPVANAFNYSLVGFNNVASTRTVTLSSITSPVLGAVPEPSAWALMLLGFGAVGFAMRRKDKQTLRIRYT